MSSREEERDQLRKAREEKEAEQQARDRKRMIAVYAGGAFLAIVIVVGAVMAFSGGGGDSSGEAHVALQSGQTNGVELDERAGTEPPPVKQEDLLVAAREADCEVRAKLPIEGRSHLPPEAPVPKYGTSPATSGNHVAPPYMQADGAYAETPEEMNVVHALEHGRLTLQYSGEIAEAEQLELRGLYDSAYSAALFFPNEEMPYEVAVSSWGEMMGCESYRGQATLDAIRAFGAEYQGTAPEPLEAFGPLAGPSFAEPS